MNKKIIIIAISTIFLTATLSSASTMTKTLSEENQSLGLIKSEISIEVISQLDEPIIPDSEPETVDITVKYKLDMGPLAKRFFFNRRIGRFVLFGFGYIRKLRSLPYAEINLTLEHIPDWCTAELNTSTVELEISNEFKEAKIKVKISVDETAPAFKSDYITIKAEFKNKNNWRIKDASNETRISFMPAYKPDITYETEKKLYIIPPVNDTTIPINITNNGNGETKVIIEIENPPANCNISLDPEEITISSGGITEQINLIVTPDKNFENETIDLKFTSKSTSTGIAEEYLKEETSSLSITIVNDGSLKEEENGGIPGFEVLTLVIALGLSLILLKRRKQ